MLQELVAQSYKEQSRRSRSRKERRYDRHGHVLNDEGERAAPKCSQIHQGLGRRNQKPSTSAHLSEKEDEKKGEEEVGG